MNDRLYYSLTLIGIILILSSVLMLIQYYYNQKANECISNPLSYAARMYEEQTGYKFVGSGSFIKKGSPIIIYFNADNVSVVNK